MKTRIFSLISTIITLTITGFGLYICYTLTNVEGVEKLSLIATFPILILSYALTFGTCLSSLITSFKGLFSSLTAVKIISIVLLIIALLFSVLYSKLCYDLIKLF